ncbi:MAG: hypothetical protein GX638_00690, partial [Crenarchaeota archaeon]|nr:hypothetical protein [Thermoproteota archaeon]
MSSSNFVDVEKKISDWKLTFNNRRYHKGLNITFRDGTHYALSMKPGDNILMVDKFGSVLGKARVVSAEALNIK